MGMHTEAARIVTDAGFKPNSPDKTYTGTMAKIKIATELLAKELTYEGLVRLLAPLEASRVASPSYRLGDGPLQFATSLRNEAEKKKTAPKATANATRASAMIADAERLLREAKDLLANS